MVFYKNKCKKDKKKCDRCPDRCVCPAVIDSDSFNQTLFFDMTCDNRFSIFENKDLVQAYNGAKVDFNDNKNLIVKYHKFKGGPSPGFVVVLKTAPCEKYRLNTTAILKEGDKAIVQVDSLYPQGTLVSKDTSLTHGILRSLELSFQAASKFTIVGIFFFCDTQDNCLKICDFTVNSCQVCSPCPIVCEPWENCRSKSKCKDFYPCPPSGCGSLPYPPFCPPFFPPCPPCPPKPPCPPCEKPCKKSGGSVRFLSINYRGISINKLENDECLTPDPDFYILETNNCKKGECKLWVCDSETNKLKQVFPPEDQFYFLNSFQGSIFKGRANKDKTTYTCKEIVGCPGDQIWDIETGCIFKFTKKGWKEIAKVPKII